MTRSHNRSCVPIERAVIERASFDLNKRCILLMSFRSFHVMMSAECLLSLLRSTPLRSSSPWSVPGPSLTCCLAVRSLCMVYCCVLGIRGDIPNSKRRKRCPNHYDRRSAGRTSTSTTLSRETANSSRCSFKQTSQPSFADWSSTAPLSFLGKGEGSRSSKKHGVGEPATGMPIARGSATPTSVIWDARHR